MGDNTTIQQLIGPTHVIQLQGKAALPGFIDAHTQPMPTRQQLDSAAATPPTVIGSARYSTLLSTLVNAGHEGRPVLFGSPDRAKLTRKADIYSASFLSAAVHFES